MPEFHSGGIIRGTVLARLDADECILARRAGADGAIVCVRRDSGHEPLCRHDPVAYTREADRMVDLLRDAVHRLAR